MNPFRNKIAIVTGGASGIGRALGAELGRRGAKVVLADLNGSGAVDAAADITASGGTAEGRAVDVRSFEAVETLVASVVEAHGRIDFMFNNAGIGVFAEERDATLSDWHKVIGVNLWGVVHGVRAAYLRMVQQGFGHIVNTASLAGLTPAPGEISYAASKHAVVGLSCALRAEAADLGVRVSVVCPGLIDTPIIRTSEVRGIERDAMMKVVGSTKWMSPDACARAILRGVEKNKAIIVITPLARAIWLLTRISPSLAIRFWQKMLLARLRPLRRAAAEAGPTQN